MVRIIHTQDECELEGDISAYDFVITDYEDEGWRGNGYAIACLNGRMFWHCLDHWTGGYAFSTDARDTEPFSIDEFDGPSIHVRDCSIEVMTLVRDLYHEVLESR